MKATNKVKQQLNKIQKAKDFYKRYAASESSPFLRKVAAEVRRENIQEAKNNILNALKSDQ